MSVPESTLPRSESIAAQRDTVVESKRESVEYRAIRECFADLTGAAISRILNTGWLAVQLYSKNLIGDELLTEAQKQVVEERVKAVNLLSAVRDQIVTSPATKFKEFLDVLRNEPSLEHLATRLENTQHELSEQCTPSLLPPPVFIQSSTVLTQSSPLIPTSSQHPQDQPHANSPPSKRPKTDNAIQSLEHTVQDFQQGHQTPVHYPDAQPGGQSSAIDTYASYLKSVYTQETLPIYDKWPYLKSKKYVNLALVGMEDITKEEADQFTKATIHGNIDDIKKSKKAMNINQIAQMPGGSQPKCILVEGAPGVGKSTFAWKLCQKWGKGKLLQQYQLVVLLRLRDKSVRATKNIPDLFRYHDHQIQHAAVKEIQRTGGKHVFLLFEGFDELPEELRTNNSIFLDVITGMELPEELHTNNSIFLDVITGRELPEATVLITSRPWASEFFHWECKRHISQHIQILGFTQANIQSYLESTTASDPSLLAGIKKYISCYPHINSLMCIPLNCAIVVDVYRNSRKDETLVPKTMTELYSSLVRSLLLRHLLDHPVHCKKRRWRIHSFDDLPQDVYKQLCELGRIAYEGILNRQQVIFSDLPEGFETLGLMQCAPELYSDEGTVVSYNFLHLTVQEYLAAFHLSQQPVGKQIEQFKKNWVAHTQQVWQNNTRPSESHFQVVLRFLSGIRKFKEYLNEMVDMLNRGNSDPDSKVSVNFTILHWLFEAQDSDVIAKFLGAPEVSFDTCLHSGYPGMPRGYVVTPFDCFVLGYCVSQSNCTWKIWLGTGSYHRDHSDCRIGDEGIEMLVHGTVEGGTHCTGGISILDLNESGITFEGVKHLLTFPKQLINSLEVLYLYNLDTVYRTVCNNQLDSKACATLAHLIPRIPHLKTLDLSDNPNIRQGGAVPLITSLTAHNSLEQLQLHETGIGVEDCQVLSILLSSSASLKELDISGNELTPEAVELIISGLHYNTILTKLDMNFSCFSLQNTISLASVLSTNHTLVYLNLRDCEIDSDGACQLANALTTNDTLQTLHIEDNPRIEAIGATAFAKMLRTNSTLVCLDLCECNIDSEGACQLASALCTNDTLQKLSVSGNSIGVEGASAVAEMLQKNKSLKVLNIRDDSVGEEGIQTLIDSVKQNATVEKVYCSSKFEPFNTEDSRVTDF